LGANTIGHIAEACARGDADSAAREGPLQLPNLVRLGLGEACRLASGSSPPGLAAGGREGRCGCAAEVSRGKDTPSGHWEIAGVPVPFDWDISRARSLASPMRLWRNCASVRHFRAFLEIAMRPERRSSPNSALAYPIGEADLLH